MNAKCIIKYMASNLFSTMAESIEDWWNYTGKDLIVALSKAAAGIFAVVVCLGIISTGIERLFFDGSYYVMGSKILTILLNGFITTVAIIGVLELIAIVAVVAYGIFLGFKIPLVGLYNLYLEAKQHCE